MDTKKLFLYAALLLISLSLWSAWQRDYPNVTQQAQQQTQTSASSNVNPAAPPQKANPVPSISTSYQAAKKENLVHIYSDVLNLTLNKEGGYLINAKLLAYPKEPQHKNDPIALLSDKEGELYVARSGIASSSDTTHEIINYQTTSNEYRFKDNQKTLDIELTGTNKAGISIKKIIHLEKGSYLIKFKYQIKNPNPAPWSGYVYSQFLQNEPKSSAGMFGISSYSGAAISDPLNKLYEKITYSAMQKENLGRNVKAGWIALQQHYFLTAWVPPTDQVNHYYTIHSEDKLFTVGTSSPAFTLDAGQEKTENTELYAGPEIADTLKTIAPGLDYTIDYGWLWYLSLAIFWLMKMIYQFVGNWGWSIVLVTLLIKIAFYKLSSTSYRSMANMRKLQPRMEELKKLYADDRQKLSAATMELYKKEKINPLGGCWPVLIQIPVFIALYWVLLESVELRQAPFILWIKDLSAADPYYVLPILMGATMLLQQLMNPSVPDPTQAKIMMLMPLFFTYLFLHFPSGLVLYWVSNNAISIIQQWYITHKFELEGNGNQKKAMVKS